MIQGPVLLMYSGMRRLFLVFKHNKCWNRLAKNQNHQEDEGSYYSPKFASQWCKRICHDLMIHPPIHIYDIEYQFSYLDL